MINTFISLSPSLSLSIYTPQKCFCAFKCWHVCAPPQRHVIKREGAVTTLQAHGPHY